MVGFWDKWDGQTDGQTFPYNSYTSVHKMHSGKGIRIKNKIIITLLKQNAMIRRKLYR